MGRASGIVMHPTSIPGPYGIGDLGANAYQFIDFLADSKQQIWQVLPLGPTSYGDSPYQCLSSMAGNTLLINIDQLHANGYLCAEQLASVPNFPADQIDFGPVIAWKKQILRSAFDNFHQQPKEEHPALYAQFEQFCAENANWLEDYALFCALKDAHGGRAWVEWDAPLRAREAAPLAAWKAAHQVELDHHRFLQFEFYRQWGELKRYANSKGISIMGDIPIFVAYDSADVWCEQGLFELDAEGRQTVVAGVPPDYFAATGQRWGNPLYRWDVMAKDGYQWWKKRIHALLEQVDWIRIDHFRGFESYWEIPASEPTAENGHWVKGPGIDFFNQMNAAFPGIKIVAEDLGGVTQDVVDLLNDAGLPGMRIMQFGFTEDNPNFLPRNYIPHCVAYTGTHDNNTTRGWFRGIPESERQAVFAYFGREISEDQIVAAMVQAIWESASNMVLIPLQDVLNLGEEARMNFPGKNGGNWAWRYRPEQLSGEISAWLAGLTVACGR